MFVDKECITFKIVKDTVYLYSEDTCYGLNTVADVNNNLYYLGNRPANLNNAIIAWQLINKVILNEDQLRQVSIDNKLMSENL